MKKLLLLFFIAASVAANAQIQKFRNLQVGGWIKMGSDSIVSISKDSTTDYGSNNKLITERAAKAYARSVGGGSTPSLAAVTAVGNTTATDIKMDNNKYYYGKTSGGAYRKLAGIDNTDTIYFGTDESDLATVLRAWGQTITLGDNAIYYNSLIHDFTGTIGLTSLTTGDRFLSVNSGKYVNANAVASAYLSASLNDETGSSGGGVSVFNNSPTVITPDFTTGFKIGSAAASGKFPIGNGTNYVPSTLILPNSATANYIPYATSANTWGQSANLQFNGSLLTATSAGAAGKFVSTGYVNNTLEIADPDGSTYITNGQFKVLTVPFVANANGSYITLQTGGVDRLRVKSTGEVGVGTTTPTSNLHTTSFAAGYVKVTEDYTVLSTDYTISVDNSSDNVTITLPDPATCPGRIYVIKRYDDNSTGSVTIATDAGKVQSPITGDLSGSTFALEAWGHTFYTVMYQSNVTNWEAIK